MLTHPTRKRKAPLTHSLTHSLTLNQPCPAISRISKDRIFWTVFTWLDISKFWFWFWWFFVFLFVFFLPDRVSLCSPGCPVLCVDQAVLKLRNPSASASQVLELKVCVHPPLPGSTFFKHYVCIMYVCMYACMHACIFFKIYLFIICKYTVAVFRHSRRGNQILLHMVVSHHVVAGI